MRAIPREVNDGDISKEEHAYALGLWCADRYWWSSSIGLSNAEPELIARFGTYLTKLLSRDRLRLRVYLVEHEVPDPRVLMLTSRVSIVRPYKMKRTAYHVYVNSRPLIRLFQTRSRRLTDIPVQQLGSYFAGRFDGDGNLGITPRIAYTTREEAEVDRRLLFTADIRMTSLFHYRKASEYCIYFHRSDQGAFLDLISEQSWKVGCRFTL